MPAEAWAAGPRLCTHGLLSSLGATEAVGPEVLVIDFLARKLHSCVHPRRGRPSDATPTTLDQELCVRPSRLRSSCWCKSIVARPRLRLGARHPTPAEVDATAMPTPAAKRARIPRALAPLTSAHSLPTLAGAVRKRENARPTGPTRLQRDAVAPAKALMVTYTPTNAVGVYAGRVVVVVDARRRP